MCMWKGENEDVEGCGCGCGRMRMWMWKDAVVDESGFKGCGQGSREEQRKSTRR